MKRFHTVLLAAGAVLLALAGCNKKPAPYGDFDNKVYIDQNTNVTTMLVKQSSTDAEHSFHAATPKPVEGEVKLLFEADESLVADYNRLFGDEAAMLPASYYSIENAETSIAAGSTRSADVSRRATTSPSRRCSTDRALRAPCSTTCRPSRWRRSSAAATMCSNRVSRV